MHPPPPALLLTLPNCAGALPAAMDRTASFLDAWAVTQAARAQVMVMLDEIASNIIRSAWPGGGEHRFTVELRMHPRPSGVCLDLEVTDDGVAFDPTTRPTPDLTLGLEERAIGGLGLFLVRELSDGVHYVRDGALNRLRVSKHLDDDRPTQS